MFSRLIMEEESSFAALNYIIVAIILIAGISYFRNKNKWPHDKLTKKFVNFTLVVYVLTIFGSLLYALPTRNVYGYILVPLVMYLYMAIFVQRQEEEKLVIITMYVITLVLAFFYFTNYFTNVLYLYDIAQVTNTSYTILYFLPFLLCARKNIFRIASIILVLLAVMFSLKRGGFIAFILSVAVYLYIHQIKMKKKKIKLWGWIMVLFVAAGVYLLVVRINSEVLGDLLFTRISGVQEEGGSGRSGIYREVFRLIGDSSVLGIFLGHGWCGTVRDTTFHLTAHNDFLEVFYDFGIIGFVLYIAFIVQLVKLYRRLIRNNSEYAPAMGASLVMFFVNSMVSHIVIYCQYMLIFTVFWGFISASENKKMLQ